MSAASPSRALVDEPPLEAQALLARETSVRPGIVPDDFAAGDDGAPVIDGWRLAGDAFVMRAEGIGFFYRRGEGIVLDAPADADARDIELWLNGTVYAAVAALNGLLPLHASAVAWDGQVYAFSGPPGAGKSTLAAALGRYGMPLFCDDTMIVDVRDAERTVTCLPGHKRLKLWPEGVELAQATALEQVASDYPKHFADPVAGHVREPLPLAELLFLEHGPAAAAEALGPGERIARLQDDHYTAQLFGRAGGLDRAARFVQQAGIASRVPMGRFIRPFARERFTEGLEFIAGHIREGVQR